MTQYLVYDVFTDQAFGGNQLAVFPDARDIPEHLLQRITAEFNFSEVTFVYPPQDPAHTARVRIFTPTTEVDFAGHPTIGTVIALSDLGQSSPMVLELGVGPLPCVFTDAGASFTASQNLEIFAEPEVALVARALGLKERDIVTTTHSPVHASLGLPFVIVELADRAALSACATDMPAIREGALRYPQGADFALFAYVRDGAQISSRMFAPLDNIIEDPATGSASATLAALLTQRLNMPQDLIFSQGVDMGRPSVIMATTTLAPLSVTIMGNAIQTMSGTFKLPIA